MLPQQLDYGFALSKHGACQANLSNCLQEAIAVQLTFLGKTTQGGGSPTLFATDRDTYVVQGWKVPGYETSVEIPRGLLGYLEPNTRLAAVLHTTEQDTYVLSGAAVTDVKALEQMDIPDHETCIEVGKVSGR